MVMIMNNRKQISKNQYPITNIQYPGREEQYPITNIQYSISKVKKRTFPSSSYLDIGHSSSSYSYLKFGHWVLDIGHSSYSSLARRRGGSRTALPLR
jgi:hypothetical protein